jgi:cell division protein ZapA
MQTVDINLLGRSYQVACAPGEEARVKKLSAMLEEKMRIAAKATPGGVGELRLFLLAGLMLADDVVEAEASQETKFINLRGKVLDEENLLITAVEHLSGRINSLAARIEAA